MIVGEINSILPRNHTVPVVNKIQSFQNVVIRSMAFDGEHISVNNHSEKSLGSSISIVVSFKQNLLRLYSHTGSFGIQIAQRPRSRVAKSEHKSAMRADYVLHMDLFSLPIY
jgi:hypothetical protein